jgi:hypothetical protein
MTAPKPTAEQRMQAAHTRLLDSVRLKPDMTQAVRDALVRQGDFIESSVLAYLVGHLAGRASNGKPLSPTRLAEIVEDVCARGVEEAARLIAKTEAKEAGR